MKHENPGQSFALKLLHYIYTIKNDITFQTPCVMAKRKRSNIASEAAQKRTSTGLPSPTLENEAALGTPSIHSVISTEELEIAVETLQSLSEHPALIKSKACKDLRAAVYDFRQASTTGMIAAGMF